MAVDALPCLVCGKELQNVWEDASNQPSDGVACHTTGNYGSTVFDSLDGETLEFNLCDPCLVRAGDQKRIFTGRFKRPVMLGSWGIVGWEDVTYDFTPWDKECLGFDPDNVYRLTEDDLRGELPERIHLRFTVAQLLEMLKSDLV